MKKTLAIVLALVMILSLATAASAASITITPPTVPEGAQESGITYTAYKIFDATITYKEVEGKQVIDKVSYTISNSSPYYNIIATGELKDYFKLTASASDANVFIVEKTDAFTNEKAETVAAALATVNNETGKINLTKDGDKYSATGLDDGYYLVTSTVGSALILDTIGDVTIATKNEYPSLEKKVENAESTTADKGEVLTFTIDVKIPANAFGEIVVHDNMTGLEYQAWTAIDGIAVATAAGDGCEVHFTLSEDYVEAHKGNTITITYTAKVTADVANNEAWLVDDTYTSTTDDTDVYSTDVVINKVDSSNNTVKLEGAKFVLKNDKDEFYHVDNNGNVTWVAAQTDATEVTTDGDGKASFENIASGTYYLVETEAPTGYNLLKEAVPVTVTAVYDEDTQTVNVISVKVENSSGTELPSTGGIGTTLFYIFGGILVVGAVVLLVTKKRMSVN